MEIGERVAVLGEQLCDLAVELRDAHVEILDVEGELADAARRRARGEALTQLQGLELLQLALAITAKTPLSATGSCWTQSARSRWIAGVRSRTKRRRCSSSRRPDSNR
jgi:hypothetical protein